MSITTKDINLLAKAFSKVRNSPKFGAVSPWAAQDTWDDCRDAVMEVCLQSNPRFDRERFVKATEE